MVELRLLTFFHLALESPSLLLSHFDTQWDPCGAEPLGSYALDSGKGQMLVLGHGCDGSALQKSPASPW